MLSRKVRLRRVNNMETVKNAAAELFAATDHNRLRIPSPGASGNILASLGNAIGGSLSVSVFIPRRLARKSPEASESAGDLHQALIKHMVRCCLVNEVRRTLASISTGEQSASCGPFAAAKDFMVMTMPGVQNPHCDPLKMPIVS